MSLRLTLCTLTLLLGVGMVSAAETNRVQATPPRRIDFDSFRVIAERNIFNPNRYARTSRPEQRREVRTNAVVDSIVLTGIMRYEKGDVAFFDGTRSEYRKAARVNSKVGDFTIVEITPRQIKLVAGTNAFQVPVGMQLRRQDGDTWEIANRPESLVASSSGSTSSSSSNSPGQDSGSSSSGTEDEVLKRLMQRREQEMNR